MSACVHLCMYVCMYARTHLSMSVCTRMDACMRAASSSEYGNHTCYAATVFRACWAKKPKPHPHFVSLSVLMFGQSSGVEKWRFRA